MSFFSLLLLNIKMCLGIYLNNILEKCSKLPVRKPSLNILDMDDLYPLRFSFIDNFITVIKKHTHLSECDKILISKIYGFLRDSGFIDKYLKLYFEHEENNNSINTLNAILDFSINVISKLKFKSTKKQIKVLNIYKKRIENLNFLRNLDKEKIIEGDRFRFGDLEIIEDYIINDIETLINPNYINKKNLKAFNEF